MTSIRITLFAIVLALAGCATSAPDKSSSAVAPGAKKVSSRPTGPGVPPCSESQEWGHAGTDAEVRAAIDTHFASRPSDELTSFHVLKEPSGIYPDASADQPVVTYRYQRNGTTLVERARVQRTDDGWKVITIEWSCTPQ